MPTELIIGLAGALGGGLSSAWIARMMIGNYLKKNDKQHDKWSKAFEKFNVAIAVLEEKVNRINGVDEKVIKMDGRLDTQRNDLNMYFTRLKKLEDGE